MTLRASFSEPSTASAPELQKNTCGSAMNGTSPASRSARRIIPVGWVTTDVWISVAAWAVMAATTFGWQWPVLVTAMPDPKSR